MQRLSETSLVLSVLGTINLNSTVYFIPITPLTDTVCAINFYCVKTIIIIIMKWDARFRGRGGGWREKVLYVVRLRSRITHKHTSVWPTTSDLPHSSFSCLSTPIPPLIVLVVFAGKWLLPVSLVLLFLR